MHDTSKYIVFGETATECHTINTTRRVHRQRSRRAVSGHLKHSADSSPFVDESLAALLLYDVLHAFSERVGLPLVRLREAREGRRGRVYAARGEPKGEGGEYSGAHRASRTTAVCGVERGSIMLYYDSSR